MRTATTPLIGAVALAMLLTGCGDSDTETPANEPATTTGEDVAEVSADEISYEGSIATDHGRFVEYPDGLRITFTSVEASPVTIGNADPEHDTEVHVTVTLANNGDQAIPLPAGETIYLTEVLLYGANRHEAQAWAPFTATGPTSSDLPRQLAPGSEIDITSVHTLPADGLDALAFEVCPDTRVYTSFVFTDLETEL